MKSPLKTMADERHVLHGASPVVEQLIGDKRRSAAAGDANADAPETQAAAAAAAGRFGPSTRQALGRLHDDMELEIGRMQEEFSRRKFTFWLMESVSFKSELSKMRWPSVFFMTTQAIAHFIVAFVLDVDNLAIEWIGFQGFVLSCLLVSNLAVNLWDTKLRFKELLMKSEQILRTIKRCARNKPLLRKWRQHSWRSADAKALFVPKSPCVHQTLTYRDNSCLNLPDYLLVRGDIIHLYPGECAPGDCVSVHRPQVHLFEGQMFGGAARRHNEEAVRQFDVQRADKLAQYSHAKLKRAAKGADFVMLSTPYLSALRISLQRSHKRPVNSVEKECFIISRKYFETFVIPSVFVLSTIVTAIHYGYLDLTDSDHKIKTISIAYLLLRPSLTIMPFLPWLFPCFWLAVNAYGSARLICCAEKQRHKSTTIGGTGTGGGGDACNEASVPDDALGENLEAGDLRNKHVVNLLATPTVAGSSEHKPDDESDLHELKSKVEMAAIMRVFWSLVLGRSGQVWRSSSLLQVLGCLTSLCCIDKVGILSWSNPTPEKLFVLSGGNADNAEHTYGGAVPDDHSASLNRTPTRQPKRSHAEVLDLSHSHAPSTHTGSLISQPLTVGRLQFDELNWRRFIANLKPLGLAIMMNNCCERSFGDYFRFYKHISHESTLLCNQTPVVKRRCICNLSRLIGFTTHAMSHYKYSNQVGIYKLIDQRSELKKDKLVSTLENTTRLRLPFPNVVCNIHADTLAGGWQAFSQGTADVVLDLCVEYWNGEQLMPLDESTRRKIMDFYHRTSITSYCSAYAYTPLLQRHKLAARYIELPPERPRHAPHLRQLANEQQDEALLGQLVTRASKRRGHSQVLVPRRHLSMDDMSELARDKYDDDDKDADDIVDGKHAEKNRSTRLLENALDELTDQVFVGMVALQYQPCADFVTLVEQLEHACIRFVHFSKENELRSRVFSEKMGLESGWNCHISLQSDKDLLDDSAGRLAQLRVDAASSLKDHWTPGMVRSPSPRISGILSGDDNNSLAASQCSTRAADDSGSSATAASLQSWRSLPSLIMQLSARIVGAAAQLKHRSHAAFAAAAHDEGISLDEEPVVVAIDDEQQQQQQDSEEAAAAGFESLAFDMSNRAKLPKGIENIRPHLDTVDNVPLQVSLFTDCTPELTREMIEIMQDYGEIVCVIGSSASRHNTAVFLQANASIAIEPLMPQSCTHAPTSSQRRRASSGAKAAQSLSPQRQQQQQQQLRATRDRLGFGPQQQQQQPPQQLQRRLCPPSTSSSSSDDASASDSRTSASSGHSSSSVSSSTSTLSTSTQSSSSPSSSTSSSSSSSSLSAAAAASEKTTDSYADESLDDDDDGVGSDYPRRLPKRRRRRRHQRSRKATYVAKQQQQQRQQQRQRRQQMDAPTSIAGHKVADIESDTSSASSTNFEDEQNSSSSDSSDDDCQTQDDPELVERLPAPSALASQLASLPCSYAYRRDEPVNLYSLILEARHFTFKMKNTFVCMICFALSISSAQFLASILFLPPMLSAGLTIWLTVVVVPLLSFSLMSTTMNAQVMKIAVGKNLQLKPENITFFVMCYLIKFIPSIIVIVLSFGLIIAHSCKLTGFGSSSLGPCWMFTYVQHSSSSSSSSGGGGAGNALNTTSAMLAASYSNSEEDLLWSSHLLTAQVCAAFLMVLYFVVISAGFVHRSHLMWQRSPTRNTVWTCTSMALLVVQLFYNHLLLQVNLDSYKISYDFLASLPWHIWLISFAWPLLVVGINMLVKRAEIKATIRQQRRARFDFNTKLGMNSPF